MSIWKVVLTACMALALGLMAGQGVSRAQFAPLVAAARAAGEEARQQAAALKRQAEAAELRLARLETENESLRAQLDRAHENLAAAPAQVPEFEPEPPTPEPEDAAEAGAEARPPARDPRERTDRSRWEDGQGFGPDGGDPAQREERRQEFATRMRQRVDEMFGAEMAKSNDPVVQERLTALNEQVQYMMDLRQQMRDAQTDEDREVLRQTIDQTRDNIRTLTEQQQEYMLRQLAAQSGITSTNAQDQFIAGLRDVQQSPYFNPGLMGGGFGGRGGGFGGRGFPAPAPQQP